MDAEIAVIGAGAAGLAAAEALARAGRSVVVLEARERIGGRVWTRRMPGLHVPVELGAEFLHGDAKATRALLRRARLREAPASREQRYVREGRLVAVDAFAEAQRAMKGAVLENDLSFADLLRRRRLPEKTRLFARLMVEGFDAADPSRASACAIAAEWGQGGALGDTQPRMQGGYGPLLEWLALELVRHGGRLRMQCAVQAVRWRRGRVTIVTEDARVEAEKAVVTLPLGVLQSKAVRIELPIEKRKALKSLVSGPVIKAALRFPTRFWDRRAPNVAFFHAPGAPFPTLWTPLPARVPLLVAWAGGPKAEQLAGKDLKAALLSTLVRIFGKTEDPDAMAIHDWAADPLARGAYSYVAVGGAGAREALARPLERTLFFAGEATSCDDSGTVSGALASGRRAAAEILQRSARRSA